MSSAKCVICTDEFPGIDDLEAHISSDHYNCLPFECEKCKFAKFPTEFAIKRHYEEDHGLVEYFIRYRVSREIYEKKQKVRECLERCIRHSDVSAGHHQIALANSRNIIGGGDYPTSSSASAAATSNHYQSRQQQQLHESEFLVGPTSKIRGAELFQQHAAGPLLSSSSAHQHHHADFGGTADNDPVSGYDSIGGQTLIGNLLEQIKPEVDTGDHFDQLYGQEVTTSASGDVSSRGIDKFITTTQAQQSVVHQDHPPLPSSFLATQTTKQPQPTTVSISVVTTNGGSGGRTTPADTPATPLIGGKQLQNGTSSAVSSTDPSSSVLAANRSMGSGGGGHRPSELQCQVCKQMVVNRATSLMYHVNVKHLRLAMFKCRSCGEEFQWNKSAAIRHAHRHGGDEGLIENNSERLFPTLNRHRREYFNLAKRGAEDGTPEPSPQKTKEEEEDGEEEREEGGGVKRAKLVEKDGKEETEGEEPMVVVDDEHGSEDSSDKKAPQTPNSILAQLVDIARGGGGAEEGGNTNNKSSKGTTSSSTGQQSTSQGGGTSRQSGGHKSIQCEGCGDMVINQEWIMLNHVNTKHLHLPLYSCVSCNKPFENYLRSYAVRHAKFYHNGDEGVLSDQREMFLGDLRDASARLFHKVGTAGGNNGGSA